MKKGFTLIELIVVIVILAIIALVSVPVINTVITQSKERAYNEQEKSIVDAAKTYMTGHPSELPKNSKCLTVAYLKTDGLLKNGDIKNPVGANYKTESEYKERSEYFNGGVWISYNGLKYKYVYVNDCSSGNPPGDGGVYSILNISNSPFIEKGVSTLQDLGTTYNSCAATGKTICLKYTFENNVVVGASVCFIKDGVEYCLVGYDNGAAFEQNLSVLRSAFPNSSQCSEFLNTTNKFASCTIPGLEVDFSIRGVEATDHVPNIDHRWGCGILNEQSGCNEVDY